MDHTEWMKRHLDWLIHCRDILEGTSGFVKHRLFAYVDQTTGKRFGILSNDIKATLHTYLWHKTRWGKQINA